MASNKRRKEALLTKDALAVSTEDIPSKARATAACAPCKGAKVRCDFPSSTAKVCQRCGARGIAEQCVIRAQISARTHAHSSRSTSVPPTEVPEVRDAQSRLETQAANKHTQRKRSHSETSHQICLPAKQPRLISQTRSNRRLAQLDVIAEVNESSTLLEDTLVGVDGAAQFINALRSHGVSGEDEEEDVELDVEDFEEEIIDIGSDSEDDEDMESLVGDSMVDVISKSRPFTCRNQSHTTGRPQSTTKGVRARHGQTALTVEELTYDPLTCPFTITGIVRCQDGTNSPVTVPSDTKLDDLRFTIAEKLGRFPTGVALQYRLASDSAKAGAISIRSDDEFEQFKDRMRGLIVPPCTASGKPSNRPRKAVLVYFEDANNEVKETTANSKKSTSNSSSRQAAVSSFDNNQSELNERRSNIISQLQERWKCKKHSKDRDVYCYSLDDRICYTLSLGNISFWALEIMDPGKSVTIDEKPITLYLRDVRPSARSTPHPPEQMGYPGPFAQPGIHGYPPGPVTMQPAWNYPVHGGTPPFFGVPMPMVGSTGSMSNSKSMSSNSVTSSQMQTAPDIVAWFSSLDEHERRCKDGIGFAQYGIILKDLGFLRLSQLTLEYVSLKDLQDWLKIKVGTAILIMQYAKEDLEALKS